MPENSLLLIVLLCQALVASYFLPRVLLRRVRYVVNHYPPSEYVRLYPVSKEKMERAQRLYSLANHVILLIGIALVLYGFYSPSKEILHWDSQTVLMFYFLLQNTPWLIVANNPGFTFFNLARKYDDSGVRSAELKRRRLFDFVSPAIIWVALAIYCFFVLLVIAVPQLWGAGYWNILFATLIIGFFATMIAVHLYGKKRDPFQSSEDRTREIRGNIQMSVYGCIAAMLFMIINVSLQPLGYGLQDIATSLYFQALILAYWKIYRVDTVDFEVYKTVDNIDSSNTAYSNYPQNRTGMAMFALTVSALVFVFVFLWWHAREPDQQAIQANGNGTAEQAAYLQYVNVQNDERV